MGVENGSLKDDGDVALRGGCGTITRWCSVEGPKEAVI